MNVILVNYYPVGNHFVGYFVSVITSIFTIQYFRHYKHEPSRVHW